MPRLFTAIEIPAAMRQRLSLIRAPLPGAKWIEPENMHITLRFAGDVDGRTAEEFAGSLASVSAKPLPVTIAGVGAFGGRDPRVLWAGVAASDQLEALYRALDLGDFEPAEPHVERYLAGVKGYETNRYLLTPAEQAAVTRRWGAVIRRYGYEDDARDPGGPGTAPTAVGGT